MDNVFKGIVGNDPIKQYLIRMVQKRKLAQSLLFAGPEGIGKSLFADRFAKLIVGTNNSQHPDIFHYHTEGKIGMHSIRTMRLFSEEVYLAPFSAPKKVFIIHNAHRMLTYSANALLKTFEEPPPKSIIILLSHSPEHFLPTILSRCQTVRFSPIPYEALVQAVQEKGFSLEKAREAAIRAQGSLGKADQFLKEVATPIRLRLLDALAAGAHRSYIKSLPLIKDLSEYIKLKLKEEEEQVRAELLEAFSEDLLAAQRQSFEKEVEGHLALLRTSEAASLFETLLSWYRDIQLLHAGADPRHLINADYHAQLIDSAKCEELQPLEKIESAISKANMALQRSLPLESCLESLFLDLETP